MHPLYLAAYFFGGATLMNAIPHLVSGLTGRRFPSPFAKPPGKGLSSAMVNLLWGFGNLVAAYFLVCRVGEFDLRETGDIAALALGMLLLGLHLARHFGQLNGGGGPGPA
ncbi:MAG: hypothetical protein WDN44_13970 [Sphingomonas sp.]